MTEPGKIDWSVDQMRITLFTQKGSPIPFKDRYDGIWESLAIGLPDVANHAKNGPSNFQWNKWENGSISLQIHKSRLDLVYRKLGNDDSGEVIGHPRDAHPIFDKLCKRFLGFTNIPYTVRLAVGSILQIQHSSYAEIIKSIKPKVSNFVSIPDEITDILFRINLPIEAKIGSWNFSVNRLTEWSGMQTFLVEVDQTGSQISTPTKINFTEQLMLDINNVVNEKDVHILGRDEISAVYNLLFEIVKQHSQIAAGA